MGVLYVVSIPDGFDINAFLEEFKDQLDGEDEDCANIEDVLEIFNRLMKDSEVWEDQVHCESWEFLGDAFRKKKFTVAVTDIHYEGKIMLADK